MKIEVALPDTNSMESFAKEDCHDFIHLWVRKELATAKWLRANNAIFDFNKKIIEIKIAISAAYN